LARGLEVLRGKKLGIARLLFLVSFLLSSPNRFFAHQVRFQHGVDHAGAGEEGREGYQVGLEAEGHRRKLLVHFLFFLDI